MTAPSAELEAAGAPARFFLGTYLRTTRAVAAGLDRGPFEDAAWVARWDVDLADRYLDALAAHWGPAPPRPVLLRLAVHGFGVSLVPATVLGGGPA